MKILEQWLTNKIYNKENADYILDNFKIKTVAIYGAGKLGELIYDDLLNSPLDIKYFIDRNADELYYGIDDMSIYNLEEVKTAEPVEMIIVTPYKQFDVIQNDLLDILSFSPIILSLEEIIYKTE